MSKIFKIDEAERVESLGARRRIQELGAEKLRAVVFEYEPNWATERVHYHNERESIYIIVEGSSTVHLNGEEHECGPGTVVYLSPKDVHGVVATGDNGMKMIEVWAPIEPDFIYLDNGGAVKN